MKKCISCPNTHHIIQILGTELWLCTGCLWIMAAAARNRENEIAKSWGVIPDTKSSEEEEG